MKYTSFLVLVMVLAAACTVEKKANKAFRLGKYQNTIDAYKKIIAKNPDDPKANYFIAESYRLSNRLKEAEPYYEKAGGRGGNKDSVKFYHAQALADNAKYDEARKVLEDLSAATANEKIKDRAQAKIDGINYLQKLNERQSYYKVKNLELIN